MAYRYTIVYTMAQQSDAFKYVELYIAIGVGVACSGSTVGRIGAVESQPYSVLGFDSRYSQIFSSFFSKIV